MKINTFLIGAPKCGTTSICNILNRHPDVFVVPGKEPRFFSHDQKYSNGINYFESLFNSKNDESILVDGSTTYSEALLERYIKSAKRIYKYNKNAKIIYCVRNPIKRIESQWLNMQLSINRGLDLSKNGIYSCGDFNQDIKMNPGIYQTCNYWNVFSLYKNYFTNKNIKVIFFEDFTRDPEYISRSLFQFLGLELCLKVEHFRENVNVSSSKSLYNSIGKFLVKIPKYRVLAANFPSWSRQIAKKFIKQKKVIQRPTWDPVILKEVLDYLQEDTQTFLHYMKKPSNYWE